MRLHKHTNPVLLAILLIASLASAHGCAASPYDRGRQTLTAAHLAVDAARKGLDAYDKQHLDAIVVDVKARCAALAAGQPAGTPADPACVPREGEAALDAYEKKFEAARRALFSADGAVTIAAAGLSVAEQVKATGPTAAADDAARVSGILKAAAPALQAAIEILGEFHVAVPDIVAVLPMLLGSGL